MDTSTLQRGAQLHSEGRLDEAERLYRTLLDGPPQQAAAAHYFLGLVQTDRGDRSQTLFHFSEALALGAASDDLFFRHGEALRALRRHREALESYDRAIALNGNLAAAHHARGVTLAALSEFSTATESYDRAVALQPDVKSFWNNRGVALEALGRTKDAVDSYDRALALDPHYVQAHHNRGSALLKAGRWEEAIASFNRAIARNPQIAESWSFRAVALATLELYAEALESSDRALALRPDYPEAHNTRSVALRALKQPLAALASAEAALAARPDFAEALNSKGSALIKLNRYEQAAETYRRALSIKGEDAAMLLNLGMALEALEDLDGAQAAFTASDALSPHLPDARFAKGLVHIRSGDIQEGFRLYETRWTQKGGPRHRYPQDTLWLGESPLGDRRLLIHAEQGFGDTIQFCRFAPLLGRSTQLALQVQPPLKTLLSRLDGVDAVYAVGEPDAEFDVHIPLMSLPLALGLSIEDVSPRMPYLTASPPLQESWAQTLPPKSGLRVGLVWSGNPGHDNDHNRSIALAALQPLVDRNAQFISLQKDYRDEDRALLESLPQIQRYEDDLRDFADTAALIACCDLVVAVDTAVAHLAGALGKPLWVLLPRFCDWRWMNDRNDTPWYPSATLFRQRAFGEWNDVVERVASRLDGLRL